MGKREIFAGNWKMFKTASEADELVTGLLKGLVPKQGREYVLFPPATVLSRVSALCSRTPFRTGAQNMYHEEQGAFTGEISPLMVSDCGAGFVLIGHSERRHIFHETDGEINLKVKSALAKGIEPMVCIGELSEERESGSTEQVLEGQLKYALEGLTAEDVSKISIAYEPVWAIGTGKVATPEMAEEAHLLVRGFLKSLFGDTIAGNVPILYGGSVKPENIEGLFARDNIDGVLVGGASLEVESFLRIINT